MAAKYDEIARDYEWAIVSAGAPDEFRKKNKHGDVFCTTTNSTCFLDQNGAGLWLFTRERVAPYETIDEMERTLHRLGIFAGDLKTVEQAGCDYPNFIKT